MVLILFAKSRVPLIMNRSVLQLFYPYGRLLSIDPDPDPDPDPDVQNIKEQHLSVYIDLGPEMLSQAMFV